jgi:hypothetical protein
MRRPGTPCAAEEPERFVENLRAFTGVELRRRRTRSGPGRTLFGPPERQVRGRRPLAGSNEDRGTTMRMLKTVIQVILLLAAAVGMADSATDGRIGAGLQRGSLHPPVQQRLIVPFDDLRKPFDRDGAKLLLHPTEGRQRRQAARLLDAGVHERRWLEHAVDDAGEDS